MRPQFITWKSDSASEGRLCAEEHFCAGVGHLARHFQERLRDLTLLMRRSI